MVVKRKPKKPTQTKTSDTVIVKCSELANASILYAQELLTKHAYDVRMAQSGLGIDPTADGKIETHNSRFSLALDEVRGLFDEVSNSTNKTKQIPTDLDFKLIRFYKQEAPVGFVWP